ncbi:MAG: TRAP transporter substrate-binding protein DctP [Treponemataceae bacterium]
MCNFKKQIFLALFLVSFFSLFSQETRLKIASMAPANSPWAKAQEMLSEDIFKNTNGRIHLTFLPMMAQGGEVGVIKRLRTVRPGQVAPLDGAIFTGLGMYELAPKSGVLTLSLPYTFKSQEELDYVLGKISSQIKDEIEAQGYMLLGWLNIGWATFYSKEEIRTPAKLKALKMDAGGFGSSLLSNSFKSAGYTVEEVAADKLIQSMKSATGVKTVYTVPMMAHAYQWYKTLPYAIDAPLCPIMSGWLVSNSAWKKISANDQMAINNAIKKVEAQLAINQQKADREYLDKIAADGGILVKLTDAETEAFRANFRNDVETMAKMPNTPIDGALYNQIMKLLDEYRAGKR